MAPRPILLPCTWPSRPPVIETPPRPVPAGLLISWPKNASCSRIPPRASCTSLPPRRCATTRCRLSLRPCTASILQPANPPEIVAFESQTISASICLDRFTFAESQKSNFGTCVCVLIYIHIYICKSIHIYIYVYVNICICEYTWHICTCMHAYIHTYI